MKIENSKKLAAIFWIFFKIGALTLGGGLAMIPIIQREVVDKQGWMDDKQIVDVFAISQSLPGVIAINSSIFLGYRIGGLAGSIVAAAGVLLPSLLIILTIFFLFPAFASNVYLQKAFAGARAGFAAIISVAVFKLAKPSVTDAAGVLIAVLAFAAITFFSADIMIVITASGLCGFVYYSVKERLKRKSAGDSQ